MRTTTPLWYLFSGLFVNIHCLPDWNMNRQPIKIAASESFPRTTMESPFMIALSSLNGINSEVNGLSSEIAKTEDITSCSIGDHAPPDTKQLPSKKKARRDNMCPADRLQFKNGGEEGGPILPSAASGQHGDVGGRNSGGGNNGSGQPRQVPILRFPRPEDALQNVLIPEKIRPRENEEVCPFVGYHVPVCAREVDAYISSFPDVGDTILDPCHLYEPLIGCLFMEDEIGFCCMMTAVAYSDLSQDQLNRWKALLRPRPHGSLFLGNIENELQSGLPNPFKLVGIDCIPLWKRQEETKIPEIPL